MAFDITRRSLLKSLALGAGALAFGARPGAWLGPEARADPLAAPRRIIVFPIANGVHDYADIGTYGGSPTSFAFGPMTSPIEAACLRADTVIIDNLEMKRSVQNVDTHFTGLTQLLTGVYPVNNMSGQSSHISLDRYLAQKIGAGLAWPSLNMGTMCDSLSYSYNADGSSVPSNVNPLDVYSKVFGSLASSAPDPATLHRLARKKSVLDAVSADVTAFERRLGAADRARAEAQLDAIRAMELRLSKAAQASSCAKPASPAAIDYSQSLHVPETMRAFIDLTVAAMACDQTRIVVMHSYLREYHPPNYKCPWAPVNRPNDDFHGLSHDSAGDNFASFVTAKKFHFQLAAELAQKLKAIPEGPRTMLDNTLIFLPTEIGNGHENASLQFVTIGGKGLGVATGRYLALGAQRGTGNGTPHQRLLVSLLQALGLPDTTFGDEPGTGSGPLPGYLA